MIIPNLPHPTDPLVDKNGIITDTWYLFFQQMVQELQVNLSQEGLNIPSQKTSDISKIQSNSPSPCFISNKDTGDAYVLVKGIFEKISTTPIDI